MYLSNNLYIYHILNDSIYNMIHLKGYKEITDLKGYKEVIKR